jgi:hypothetical protein
MYITRWSPTVSKYGDLPDKPLLATDTLEVKCYILLAGLFLAVYFLLRFAMYPQFLYQLDLGDRLQAQYDHRFLFTLSLASPAALTAVTVRWVVNNRLTKWDKVLAAIVFIGLLSGGSKLSVAPIFLTYLGVAIYVGKTGMFGRAIRVILPMAIILSLALIFLFPTMSGLEIIDMMIYRIVANTEELEFLYYLNFQPDQYPFAGLGALFAPIAKLLGENIGYSPGVWLFGQRYDDWSGFGPNSGFVIELFGNLGWFGLAVPLVVGTVIGYCETRLTTYRVVFLSLLPIAFTESLIFFIAVVGHIALMVSAKLLCFFVRKSRENTDSMVPMIEATPLKPPAR